MFEVEYSPKALEDLFSIKDYVNAEFGDEVAHRVISKLTKDIRRLELFPLSGQMLSGIIEIPTDYFYLYSKKNYVFYRLEETRVKVVRILNEQQDYVQIFLVF